MGDVFILAFAGFSWADFVGYEQRDPDAWLERFNEMCAAEIWMPDVALEFANRYRNEDPKVQYPAPHVADLSSEDADQMAIQVLQGGPFEFCPEAFPDHPLTDGT